MDRFKTGWWGGFLKMRIRYGTKNKRILKILIGRCRTQYAFLIPEKPGIPGSCISPRNKQEIILWGKIKDLPWNIRQRYPTKNKG